ncbi:MAG: hypothetical protein QNK29_11415 [Desulfobacterales bacterium]|nr:hypothetical protein [Desulfobacterales bacterium]MDX2512564.1 hypothetical protein [Desulfobacterales bacterium]
MPKKNKPASQKGDSLFKSVMLAYVVLVLHVLLMLCLGLLIIFFRGVIQYMLWIFLFGMLVVVASSVYFYRRMKAEGKTLKQTLSSTMFAGRPVEVSFLGGIASLRVGMPGSAKGLETRQTDPTYQLEDFKTIQLRDLTRLARLLEDDLITRDEYDEAKKNLFKPTE